MKIAGHLILRNEETFVKYTVPNLAKKVDFVVILDTGSTDKTLEIIDSLKLNNLIIYNNPLNCKRFDFHQGEIRNWIDEKCVEHGADYIFIQDGDELINCDLYNIILSNNPYYTFSFYDVIFRKYIKSYGIHNHIRLYKSKYLKWNKNRHCNMIHENDIIHVKKDETIVENDYFFHLHRYNNKNKKDEGILRSSLFPESEFAEFPKDVVFPQELLDFWEEKGI